MATLQALPIGVQLRPEDKSVHPFSRNFTRLSDSPVEVDTC